MRRANPNSLAPYANHRGGETARACGITYRQLDHWSTSGYLHPIFLGGANHNIPAGRGSGHWRDWPAEELRVAREMGLLTAAGLIPEVAHRIARSYRTGRVLHALGCTPALRGLEHAS